MADSLIPTAESLRQLFRYEPGTGRLFWLPRHPDAGGFNTKFAGREAFTCVSNTGRRTGRINGKILLAHRVIWAFVNGAWPAHEIDHINGDPLDNRIENLRDVERLENARNRPLYRANKSGMAGIYWRARTKRWLVDVGQRYIGSFASLDDAKEARQKTLESEGYHPNHGRG